MPPCARHLLGSMAQILAAHMASMRGLSRQWVQALCLGERRVSPLCELIHQDVWAVLKVEGPCQVVDRLGSSVSVAGALGGAIPCGQRLAGMPGEERMPVLRLRTAGEAVGRGAAKPAGTSHEAGLFFCMRAPKSTGCRVAKGDGGQTAHEG